MISLIYQRKLGCQLIENINCKAPFEREWRNQALTSRNGDFSQEMYWELSMVGKMLPRIVVRNGFWRRRLNLMKALKSTNGFQRRFTPLNTSYGNKVENKLQAEIDIIFIFKLIAWKYKWNIKNVFNVSLKTHETMCTVIPLSIWSMLILPWIRFLMGPQRNNKADVCYFYSYHFFFKNNNQ